MWNRITHRAYAAHLWNKKTASLTLNPGSVLERLLGGAALPTGGSTTTPEAERPGNTTDDVGRRVVLRKGDRWFGK